MLIDWADAPRAPEMRRGATRRVVSSEHTTVVSVETDPDAPFDGVAHRHDHEQWVVVTAGVLWLRCGPTESELRTGDVVHVPPRQWHAATGVGPDGARYLEMSTPPRLDLLPGSLVASPLEFEADPPTTDPPATNPPATNPPATNRSTTTGSTTSTVAAEPGRSMSSLEDSHAR